MEFYNLPMDVVSQFDPKTLLQLASLPEHELFFNNLFKEKQPNIRHWN